MGQTPKDLIIPPGATGETEAEARRAAARKLEAETLAKRKAIEDELARKGAAAVENQASALKGADDVALFGMNEAANIGAAWCAHGATVQSEDRELAEQSYGNCKNYMGAADGIREQRGKGEAYTPNQAAMSGDWAKGALDGFEKKFGVEPETFMSSFLGATDRIGELGRMTDGKLDKQVLASAYENGIGKEDFEVKLGRNEPKKGSSLRDSIKKTLDAEAKRKPAADSKPKEKAVVAKAEMKIRGLTPLENQFAGPETTELNLFQVVHRKYKELAERL